MKTLREYIREAEEKKTAIGHFNVSNSDGVWGIFHAAQKLSLPVIIGVSESERNFFGIRQVSAMIESLRDEYDYPIFLNADHTHSFEEVKKVVDAGFDSITFDGVELPKEKNISEIKKSIEYAKQINPNILIEGEMGFIGASSEILDGIPEGVSLDEKYLTDPEEAKSFVEETGIDMLAPAVGNMHGMLRGGIDPKLNIERIKSIKEATGLPLVLHGASGNSKEDIKSSIQNGISIVHINTEIRLAYRKGLEEELNKNAEEIAPYKFLSKGIENVEEVVIEKIKIFSNL